MCHIFGLEYEILCKDLIKAKENNTDGLQAMARQRLADYNEILVHRYSNLL